MSLTIKQSLAALAATFAFVPLVHAADPELPYRFAGEDGRATASSSSRSRRPARHCACTPTPAGSAVHAADRGSVGSSK
jgi:hypothetical protein